MTGYVDVFNNDLVPPSGYAYQALTFSGTTNPTFWPYNYAGAGIVISKIIDASMAAGSTIQLPDATQVSPGEDLLIFNTSAFTLTVQSYTGSAVTTIAAGTGKYLYVKTNTTTAGTWGVITYGTGTSAADAAALAGYGLSALGGATLNTAFTSTDKTVLFTLDNTYRAKLVNATSGTWTLTLQAAATATSTFFFLIRNSGSGIITIDPNGAETIDGQTTKDIRSGESAIIICNGTGWFSVGYGRAVQGYTLLSQSVTAGGTIALTAAQALNQLINFTGSPAAAVTVTVPNTVGIWYLTNSSTQTVTFKGVTGTGYELLPNASGVAKCDGTNMVDAFLASVTEDTRYYNTVINGNFTFDQRRGFGTFPASTAGYGPDRWYVSTPTNVTGTYYNPSSYYAGPGFSLTRAAGTTSAGNSELVQVLEYQAPWSFAVGQKFTLAVWWYGNNITAGGTMTISHIYGNGVNETPAALIAGTWSSQTIVASTSVSLSNGVHMTVLNFTNGAAFYSGERAVRITVTNPGTTGGSAESVVFLGVLLTEGTVTPTAIYPPDRAFELERCQRFYEKSFALATIPAQNVGIATGETRFLQVVGASTAQGTFSVSYKTRKRAGATPTITLYNPAAANAQFRNITGSTDWSASTASSPSETGFFLNGTSAAASTAGSSAAIHWTADYEL